MKNNKLFYLVLPLVLGMTSCGMKKTDATFNPDKVTELSFNVDKNKLYGVCDLSFEEYDWRAQGSKIDYHQSHLLMKNLGANTVRFWTQFYYFMESPTTLKDPTKYRELREMYEDLIEVNPNVTVIGMSHTSYVTSEQGAASTNISSSSKPRRDLTPNSAYMKWLQNYEQTWYSLVRIFPEIEYWEIDNEINNNDFMKPLDGGKDFTTSEKAKIAADMLFFGSRGIHRANINAKTISGGIIVFNENETIDFVNELYNEIARNTWGTTKSKDFFQIFGMHPYINTNTCVFTKKVFTDRMNAIYEVVKAREGKDKIVYCTEVGFNDCYLNPNTKQRLGQEGSASMIKDMFEAALELPYVETLCYYKMYDVENVENPENGLNRYGLFVDPINKRQYNAVCDGGTQNSYIAPSLASPKPGATIFQQLTGGSGDLYAYANALKY